MADQTRRRHRTPVRMAPVLVSVLCALWVLSGGSTLTVASAAADRDASVLETALHFFTRHDAAGVLDRLDAARPPPVTPAEREIVLATLPADGHVSDLDLNTAQRHKLAAVRRILELHARETLYVIKVIKAADVPRAAVGLHARAVVLITQPALDLLNEDELQALVAHEVGHEYVWSDYARAQRDEDRLRLRTLELLCDGFALITLRRAGIDARHLTAALEKVIRYNRDRFGAALNEDHYPALHDRRRFATRLLEWLHASP